MYGFRQLEHLEINPLRLKRLILKLKLNLHQFESAEVLTRSQLKKILGGDDGGSGGGDGTCNCNSADDCKTWNEQCLNSCGGKPGDTYQVWLPIVTA